MSKTIKVALAGAGAFGIKHLDGIKNIDGVEVVSLISRDLDKTKEVAAKYGIGHVTTDLAESLALKELDAVILCTPTQMHAEQTLACLKAGQTRAGGDSAGRQPGGRAGRGGAAEEDRTGRHVRPHAPLQPEPPVRAQRDHGRPIQHPADGCADLLFPPHQHQRAGPGRAAGPTTCCGTTLRTRWTCLPTSAAARSCRPTPSRARSTRRWASPWT